MRVINILLYCFLLTILACSNTNEPERPPAVHPQKLIVEGKPFLMLGAQLRTDYFLQLDKKTLNELEPYFELAANMNILVIQVPVGWRDIEVQKDIYNTELVEKYIELCDKYQMKLEILWFGSYMCGYSVEGYIPEYIVNDPVTYPDLKPDAAFDGWLGKHYYLKPNTPALVERESKALGKMMEAIYNYDNIHNQKHTVIGIQIENEPDMLATRHNEAHGYTPEQIWPDLIIMLDKLGQVVKSSPYDCYTRVNQTTTYPEYLTKSTAIAITEGIDYVGVDPYENSIQAIDGTLRQLRKIEGNYAHIAENGGEYANNDLLALKAFSLGCGYEIFEVITTPHPFLTEWTLRGIYNPDFTPKAHTQQIVDAFKIFKEAWVDFANANYLDIAGFNLKSNDGMEQTSESKNTTHAGIKWSTKSRGVAFAIEYNDHLTVASTKSDEMVFRNIQIKSIEKGHYDIDGNWVSEEKAEAPDNRLAMEPCIVYRIKF